LTRGHDGEGHLLGMECGLSPYPATFDQFCRIDRQCVRKVAKHRDTHRGLTPLDLPDIPNAKTNPIGEFFLRPPVISAQPTQVDRHHILEIGHGEHEPPAARSFQERYFLFGA
jgi:hypothetical protein